MNVKYLIFLSFDAIFRKKGREMQDVSRDVSRDELEIQFGHMQKSLGSPFTTLGVANIFLCGHSGTVA